MSTPVPQLQSVGVSYSTSQPVVHLTSFTPIVTVVTDVPWLIDNQRPFNRHFEQICHLLPQHPLNQTRPRYDTARHAVFQQLQQQQQQKQHTWNSTHDTFNEFSINLSSSKARALRHQQTTFPSEPTSGATLVRQPETIIAIRHRWSVIVIGPLTRALREVEDPARWQVARNFVSHGGDPRGNLQLGSATWGVVFGWGFEKWIRAGMFEWIN